MADRSSFDFSLPPGSTYTHIHPIVFPHDIEGDRWISVCADWNDDVESTFKSALEAFKSTQTW